MAIICIDIGHGGRDPGTSGKGMTEAKINFNVGMKLKELLEKDGHTVVMTRDKDVYVDLLTRSRISNKAGALIFISIHHNAGGGDGFEIIYKMNCKKSLALAQEVEKEFRKLNNERRIFTKPGIKNPKLDYYSVLRETKAVAIITEFAFLDNPKDVLEIDTLTEQWEQAEGIYYAVKAYLVKSQ